MPRLTMRMRRRRQYVGALHGDGAAARPDQARDDAHQGRLAGAVGADHADRLAGPHLEVDAEQRLEGAVARVDAGQREHAAVAHERAAAAWVACASLPR
jgi:hypothetical protein